jgi:hypothetical protein
MTKDVERQSPHRCGGVELLRDRDEGDAVAVEHVDQLGEVRQAAREAVDFVDDHGIDLPRFDVDHQTAQPGPFHVAARVAAVVVSVVDGNPALMPLAGNKGQARITLCFEAVVFLVEPFISGLAGVDGAALLWRDCGSLVSTH